ncbi:MAG: hypothetical protein RI885_2322, partial [Actinomycetota bacterium]
VVADDRLRLIFLCCHPALDAAARVALSLRVLGGLEVAEIADALLVSEPAMAKRLTRARAKIRDAGIPYRVPSETELPERLDAVATVILLIFNEGYASRRAGGAQRVDLAVEAIRLARALREVMPGEAVVEGLLATMLLQHSRRAAREVNGETVLLADQDRGRWDHPMVAEGTALAAEAVRHSAVRGTRFAVMAAIAALESEWPPPWSDVVDWYDVLVTFDPSPVVRLNRASAIAESLGAAEGLLALEEVDGLDGYPWFHASRGELLLKVGRSDDAAAAFSRAITVFGADDAPVVRRLARRRGEALATVRG